MFTLTPARLLPLVLVELGTLWLIVLTGAAVRLTDSGLGCRHWPGCEEGHPLPAKSGHAFIEFGNRLFGALTIAATLLVWLAARRTPGLPRNLVRLPEGSDPVATGVPAGGLVPITDTEHSGSSHGGSTVRPTASIADVAASLRIPKTLGTVA